MCRPFGVGFGMSRHPGLAPWATLYRPFGAVKPPQSMTAIATEGRPPFSVVQADSAGQNGAAAHYENRGRRVMHRRHFMRLAGAGVAAGAVPATPAAARPAPAAQGRLKVGTQHGSSDE